IYAQRRRKKAAIRYASLALVRDAIGAGQGVRRHLPPALFLLAMTAAILAIARPSAVLVLPSDALTLVLAIDVSRSMRAEDVSPNRISAAQVAARTFIEQLPKNMRVGIVTFAGTASAVQTPTTNKEELLAAIDRFELQRATATGNGLLLALAMLLPDDDIDLESVFFGSEASRFGGGIPIDRARKAEKAEKKDVKPVPPGSYTGGGIILMSDGRRTTGIDPFYAAKMAADRGVRVHTVGFGSKEGAAVSMGGWSFFAVPDEETLKAIAHLTGGEYFHAADSTELGRIYRNLGTKFALERQETEIGALLSATAGLLMLGAALLSLLWMYRRP
ncbi:MAG: VWA domain-containing protein, partial [Burkholderiales bacterium]|nr:VWA domain-containing protein [Burkholderiales bacterium]